MIKLDQIVAFFVLIVLQLPAAAKVTTSWLYESNAGIEGLPEIPVLPEPVVSQINV